MTAYAASAVGSCPACQRNLWRKASAVPALLECRCGIVRNPEALTQAYDLDYFTRERPAAGQRDFTSAQSLSYDDARFSTELRTLVGSGGGTRSLLDFGAATGRFLHHAALARWITTGIEPSGPARDIARNDGHEMYASLSDLPEASTFDVITAHHVLEHLDDPVALLRDLHRILKPEGRLILEVPNWASNERRACGGSWIDLRLDQHKWYFSPQSLAAVLRRAGWQPLRIGTLGEPVPTLASVLCALGIPIRLQRGLESAYSSQRVPTADGAGHGRPAGRMTHIAGRSAKAVDFIVDRIGRGKRLYAVATEGGGSCG